MGLFSLKENRAGLLTQFYQLDVPDITKVEAASLAGSDLDRWILRSRFRGIYRPEELERADAMWTKVFDQDSALRDLIPIAEVHPLLHRCMIAAASHSQPSLDDQRNLNDIIKRHLDPPLIIWDEGLEASVRHGRNGNNSAIVGLLLSEFVKAIGDKSFTRCEVCSSVFPRSRTGMKYCSERCNNRAKVTRFREKENLSELDKIAV